MTDEFMSRAQALFLKALEQPMDKREAWLREQCSDDETLLEEVLSLLEHDSSLDGPLDDGVAAGDVAEALAAQSYKPDRAFQIQCPHCQNPIEIVDHGEPDQIVCGSCGSSFSYLDVADTRSFKPFEPRKFARFELQELLGEGANGSVFRAADSTLARMVAVKIPRKTQLNVEDVERFQREARAAAQLRHPNIVQVHETGVEDGTLYIVSDLINGMTLGDWISGRPLAAREAARLCISLADALHYAHEQGVIHRDLKPSNIMLDQEGHPYLMDFGLAKRDAAEISMTLEGRFLGTPAYASPEQAELNSRHADRRSDIYSLGVVLYELLARVRPFRGTVPMLLHQIQHVDAPSLRELDATIPIDIESICLKCLEKNPSARYQTALELSNDLQRFIDGKPTVARPITRFARGIRWCRRNPLIASLTALVVLSMVVGTTVSMLLAREAQEERDAAVIAERNASYQASQTESTNAELALQTGRPDVALHALTNALQTLPDGEPEQAAGLRHRIAQEISRVHRMRHAFSNQGDVKYLRFSPSGKHLLAITHPSGTRPPTRVTIRSWKVETGEDCGEPIALEASRLKHVETSFCDSLETDVFAYIAADDRVALHRMDNLEQIRELTHSQRVRGIALRNSEDGAVCATACDDGAVRLWQVDSGELLQELKHQARRVHLLANNTILTSDNKVTRVWNEQTGERIGTDLDSGEVLDISASGTRLLSKAKVYEQLERGRAVHEKLRLWDLEQGAQLGEDHPYYTGGGEFQASFGPRGDLCFSVSRSKMSSATLGVYFPDRSEAYEYLILNAQSGEVIRKFKRRNALTRLLFSPDNSRLAMGALWGFATVQGTAYGSPIGPALEHNAGINHLEFSTNSRLLLTSSNDGESILWETTDGRQVGQPIRHAKPASLFASEQLVSLDSHGRLLAAPTQEGDVMIWSLAERPDAGARIGSGSADYDLTDDRRAAYVPAEAGYDLWDLETTAAVKHVPSRTLTPDGKTLIGKGGTEFYNADTGTQIQDPFTVDEKYSVISLSSDVRFALLKRGNRYREQTDIPEFMAVETKTGDPVDDLPTDLIWLSLSGREATAIQGIHYLKKTVYRDVEVWDLSAGKPSGVVLAHPKLPGEERPPRVIRVRFVAENVVQTHGGDNTLRLWDVRTGKPLGRVIQHPRGEDDKDDAERGALVAAQAIGKHMLTIGSDHTMRIWEAPTGDPVGDPMQHPAKPTIAELDEERGRLLTTCGNDAYVWSLQNGALMAGPLEHDAVIQRAEFAPEDDMVLTRSGDVLQLWQVKSGTRAGVPMDHQGAIKTVIFSPQGDKILTSCENALQLWDAKSGEPMGRPMLHADPPEPKFSEDGQYIASRVRGPRHSHVDVWHVASQFRVMQFVSFDDVTNMDFVLDNRALLTAGYRSITLRRLPAMMEGTPEQIRREIEIATCVGADGASLPLDEWRRLQSNATN